MSHLLLRVYAKTRYYYVGDQLTYERRGDGTELYYFYDNNGTITGLRHVKSGVSTDYVLVTNWRGDVELIYNTAGAMLARYTYDAWGKVVSIKDVSGNEITDQTHIANVNPIRYRGYYQDTETGMYYLQSRYYDPVVHRFLNADVWVGAKTDVFETNIFSYCTNNPVNFLDGKGESKIGDLIKNQWNKAKAWGTNFLDKKLGIKIGAAAAVQTVDLGKGYKARVDKPHNNNDQDHIHVYKKGKEVANQNKDGSPRHPKKNKSGEPPSSVKKELKLKIGWDWDSNTNKYIEEFSFKPDEYFPEIPGGAYGTPLAPRGVPGPGVSPAPQAPFVPCPAAIFS